MRNLVLSPLFTNLEHWTPDPYVKGETAQVSARNFDSLTGTCDAPRAGETLNVSVKVTGPVKIRVTLTQSGKTLGSATTDGIPSALSVVAFNAVAVNDMPVSLTVALADSYSGYAAFTVTAPEVLAPDVVTLPPKSDPFDLVSRVSVLVPADPALIAEAVSVVTEAVKAYTRDEGFSEVGPVGKSGQALASVIVTASARMVANPDQTTYEAIGDSQSKPSAFQGFTLAELIVLNRYRKRAW